MYGDTDDDNDGVDDDDDDDHDDNDDERGFDEDENPEFEVIEGNVLSVLGRFVILEVEGEAGEREEVCELTGFTWTPAMPIRCLDTEVSSVGVALLLKKLPIL